jgi:hypothetical protein
MYYVKTCLSVAAILATASLSSAGTIHVSADQPTIQAGIDAAVDGDTVLVADGTYTGVGNRDIDFLGKAIVVMSENGPETCIIDCESLGRGFNFQNAEDSNSILQGFTIRNGWASTGGGILCSATSPTIRGNILTGNTATGSYLRGGGGIYCGESSPVIEDNVMVGNATTTMYSAGGAIDCSESSPMIEGNTITRNTANGWGGGINAESSSPTIVGNLFTGNTAVIGAAGGIGCWSSTALITDNTITGNTAGGLNYCGGGIAGDDGAVLTIEHNTILGNLADWGAGITIARSQCTISHNTIANNSADMGMGGIYVFGDAIHSSSAEVASSTITGNNGGNAGSGGIGCWDNCTVTISSTILWNNDGFAEEIFIGSSPQPSTLTISYSDVEWGLDSVFVGPGNTLKWDEGMIDGDPAFSLPEKRDFRLLWESPCIDTGHPDSLDADGTRCDMGAHFFNQEDYLTLYITPDTTEVAPGGELGVTYTAINRWGQDEPFWALSQVLLPGGGALNVLGPDQYTLPANYAAQVHITHPVPTAAPAGTYDYWSRIGLPPSTLYDEDRFTFRVTE